MFMQCIFLLFKQDTEFGGGGRCGEEEEEEEEGGGVGVRVRPRVGQNPRKCPVQDCYRRQKNRLTSDITWVSDVTSSFGFSEIYYLTD